jgi:hypothetical protein
MLPTSPQRASHDYQRNGTLDLFAALEVATGKVITDLRARHTSADFVAFLNKVNRAVPQDLAVHVILDNLATHKTPTMQTWLLRHKGFHFHFTADLRVVDEPRRTLVLRVDDEEAAALHPPQRQRARRRHPGWIDNWNTDPKPFVWHKTAAQIFECLAGYCTALNENATK